MTFWIEIAVRLQGTPRRGLTWRALFFWEKSFETRFAVGRGDAQTENFWLCSQAAGVEAFEVAGVVLMTNDLGTVATAVPLSRIIMRNI